MDERVRQATLVDDHRGGAIPRDRHGRDARSVAGSGTGVRALKPQRWWTGGLSRRVGPPRWSKSEALGCVSRSRVLVPTDRARRTGLAIDTDTCGTSCGRSSWVADGTGSLSLLSTPPSDEEPVGDRPLGVLRRERALESREEGLERRADVDRPVPVGPERLAHRPPGPVRPGPHEREREVAEVAADRETGSACAGPRRRASSDAPRACRSRASSAPTRPSGSPSRSGR